MKLKDVLKGIEYKVLQGDLDKEITRISQDSREVNKNDLFVCITGARFDSHDYIQDVIDQGASAILVEKDLDQLGPITGNPTIIKIDNTRLIEGELASNLFGNPSEKLITIGVTGSKGKTTTAHMVANILKADGKNVGTIGTNGIRYNDYFKELTNTTPSALEMQEILKDMVEANIKYVVIECSSQGLMQRRTGGIQFDIGCFLNISKGDHIGPTEHKDFNDYLHSKGHLLEQSNLGVVFRDDPHFDELLEPIKTEVITFGADKNSDYYYSEPKKIKIGNTPSQEFKVNGKLNSNIKVKLPGDFNILNALAAVAICSELGVPVESINEGLTTLKIKGRFDIVFENDEIAVCVDFAHNGISTENHLKALREYNPKRLVCIFGADGGRSIDRRTGMGEASGNLADLSIPTSGHNRWETFEEIFKSIKIGLERTDGEYIVIPKRKDAIRYALKNRQKGDLITILGLGHENYQEENGVMYPYSDEKFVLEVVKELGIK